MAWRIIKQPNGLYARWSDIVDDFTHFNYSRTTMLMLIGEEWDVKITNADNEPKRWQEALEMLSHLGKKGARVFAEAVVT